MTNYSALIIDDEIENIQLLELYLKKYFKQIDTLYNATTLKEGTELFLEHKPNILFLDINLGQGETSFSLLENYDTSTSKVIIISSFEEFALKAINMDVMAYLLKPLKINELINAVSKTIQKLNAEKTNFTAKTIERNSNLIAIASVEKIELIAIDEIMYCTADGKYTVFHTLNNKTYTSCRNLGEYQELLDSNFFFRIHHKYIVNINFVKAVNKTEGYFCEMKNHQTLPISIRKQDEFNRFIRLKF
ncbi:LytR/AlgR family response regulator transcription factor [Flavobacterium ponti]|uniref:LytR/AlgR family response regulator transcription factor n=1 Tax=Flavobacterium ponti TaxID=665133 RepID=A0ABV9P346_9FLAO